jgi:hypothetical protein
VDFSFTPEQEDLRREARAFLEENPSPTMDQLTDLGWVGMLKGDDFTFLDAAVLFEELGRVLYDGPFGESLPRPSVSSTVVSTSPAAVVLCMSGVSTLSTASRWGTKPSISIDQTSSSGWPAISLSTNGPS